MLHTKLYIPRPRAGHVTRPRLIQQLEETVNCQLTLVSAPAGYGKTTLLAEWACQTERPVCWLSLDKGDNDPARFMTYLLAALRTRLPGLGESMQSVSGMAQPFSVPAVIETLLQDLASSSSTLCLVLDDYHLIHNAEVHSAISSLVQHTPSTLHLIIASRTDPPLPLARMRVQAGLCEIRADELRFLSDETFAFLCGSMGLKLDQEEAAALEAQTEGWIAGLQLTALSLRGVEDVAALLKTFSGGNRFVADYLVDEVLQGQPREVQDFLLATCLANRLCGPLCDALTGDEGSQAMLERLERENLFLIPLDQRRIWYRYHHLFSRWLRQQLQRQRPETIRELHTRASSWYEEQQQSGEAVHHALQGEDYDRAERLIEDAADRLWARSELATLLFWLESLPETRLRANAQLCLYHAWASFLVGNMPAAEGRLADAERLLAQTARSAESKILDAQRCAIRSSVARVQGRLEEAIDLARSALQDLPRARLNWRIVATVNLGLANNQRGQPDRARQAFEEAHSLSLQAGNIYAQTVAAAGIAQALIIEGDLAFAAETCRQALNVDGPEGKPVPTVAARVQLRLAHILLEWNDLTQAERQLNQALALGEREQNARILVEGGLMRARLRLANGRPSAALDELENAGRRMWSSDVKEFLPLAEALKARLRLKQGQMTHVCAWAASIDPDLETDPDLYREFELLTLVRLWLAQGDHEKASTLLAVLDQCACAAGRSGSRVEILTLSACASQAQSNPTAAQSFMTQALQLGERGGYLRTFLECGPEAGRLLNQIASDHVGAPYMQRLRLAFLHSNDEPAKPSPLSARETQVLALVAQGLTDRQIASSLVLSVGTIKTHLRRTYLKLEARNRAEAITRAHELNLL